MPIPKDDVDVGECGGTEEVLYCSQQCQDEDEGHIVQEHEGKYVRLQELHNGNLRIVMARGKRQEFAENILPLKRQTGINNAFMEMLDDFHADGSWWIGNASDAGHMSETMLIAEHTVERDGDMLLPDESGKQWINPNYAVDDEVQMIYDRGWYTFEPLEKYAS